MIIYDLCCDNEHRFEGWFQSPADFDVQLERGLIHCPQCDSGVVRRVPSAVAIGGHPQPVEGHSQPGRSTAATFNAASANAQIKSLYQQLVSAVMAASEDVGTGFAEEARRIHYNEAPERPIRGQTTDEEYEALQDEGIEIIRLPLPRKEDLS